MVGITRHPTILYFDNISVWYLTFYDLLISAVKHIATSQPFPATKSVLKVKSYLTSVFFCKMRLPSKQTLPLKPAINVAMRLSQSAINLVSACDWYMQSVSNNTAVNCKNVTYFLLSIQTDIHIKLLNLHSSDFLFYKKITRIQPARSLLRHELGFAQWWQLIQTDGNMLVIGLCL